MKKTSMNVLSLSCCRGIIRLTVLCVSSSFLASSSSTSSLILHSLFSPRMIMPPKNVFLQVFNTLSLKHDPSGCFVCALLF